jgi:hypothetical protein
MFFLKLLPSINKKYIMQAEQIEPSIECIDAFEKHIKALGMNPSANTVRMNQFWGIWKAAWRACSNKE